MCGLMYQVVWFHQFRHVFGTSTAATAAVTAIFMIGLGLGGLVLRDRAERHGNALVFYGRLEIGVSASAVATLILVPLANRVYLGMGGSFGLGPAAGNGIRILLAAIVLGLPTLLMGATLPAAVKAGEDPEDDGRSRSAFLYGANALGGLAGVAASAFFCMESLGAARTLAVAAGINLMVGLSALCLSRETGVRRDVNFPESPESRPDDMSPSMGRMLPKSQDEPQDAAVSGQGHGWPVLGPTGELLEDTSIPSGRFPPVAAFTTGMTFFLMEMVWYRLLSPLLGGTVYTFAITLIAILAGIGAGGLFFSLRSPRSVPTYGGFAAVCALGVVGSAFPWWLGDRLVELAGLIQSLGSLGFGGRVMEWLVIAFVTVFPAAFFAGLQFPWLISLMGRGDMNVARHTGALYAANTLGAVTGSLAGGFGLIPVLSAPGCWVAAATALGILALAAAFQGRRDGRAPGNIVICLGSLILGYAMFNSGGPSPAWRHGGVGASRAKLLGRSRNEIKEWFSKVRRGIVWEADGIEFGIGLYQSHGISLVTNGKSDGNSIVDASTQISLGLVGAALHAAPRTAFVLGLGTGCTAGWLADLPGIERVDVVELEPRVLEMASRCAAINRGVLDNPRVRLMLGDGREYLLTTDRTYDLIVSEPSNPFRAGMASLFTREFFRAAGSRLAPGGIFCQWVQTYEIAPRSLGAIYATLGTEFPCIETWRTSDGDLLLLCSYSPIRHSIEAVRERTAVGALAEGLWTAWRGIGPEGFYTGFMANDAFAADLVGAFPASGRINTDDRPFLEYEFAKTLGAGKLFDTNGLSSLAVSRDQHRPKGLGNAVFWEDVREASLLRTTFEGHEWDEGPTTAGDAGDAEKAFKTRVAAHKLYQDSNMSGFLRLWETQPRAPRHPLETLMVAEAMAAEGREGAIDHVASASRFFPCESRFLRAVIHFQKQEFTQAATELVKTFEAYRGTVAPFLPPFLRAINLAAVLAALDESQRMPLFESLRDPFPLGFQESTRREVRLMIAMKIGFAKAAQVLADFEPNVPWRENILKFRLDCYRSLSDPRLDAAREDLETFRENAPPPLAQLFAAPGNLAATSAPGLEPGLSRHEN